MDLKLKSIGILEYDYFDALDGRLFKERKNEYFEYCREKKIKPFIEGTAAFGCLMSFCEFFRTSNLEPQILFEDDIYFHKDFWEIVDSLPDDLLDDYDLVYLGHNNHRYSDNQIECIKKKDLLIHVSTNRKFCTYGAYGILYSRKAIEFFKQIFLSDMPNEKITTSDFMIWQNSIEHLRCVLVNPQLVIPEVRQSNIREGKDFLEFFTKRLVNVDEYMHIDKFEQYSGLD